MVWGMRGDECVVEEMRGDECKDVCMDVCMGVWVWMCVLLCCRVNDVYDVAACGVQCSCTYHAL